MLQLRASAVAPSRVALAPRSAARAARCPSALAPQRRVRVSAANKKKAPEPEPEAAELSGPAQAVVYAGLVTLPETLWSEYTLFSTGAGLQGDVLGGIEGVSYLVLLAVLGLSVQKKVSTGVGLEGTLPGALHGSVGAHGDARSDADSLRCTGAVEGIAFLAALGGIVAAGSNALKG